MRAIIFLNVFFPVFFKVFCKLGLGLVLALRLVKYFLKKIDFVHAWFTAFALEGRVRLGGKVLVCCIQRRCHFIIFLEDRLV